MNRKYLSYLVLSLLLIQCTVLGLKNISDRMFFKRLVITREKKMVEDIAARIDTVIETLLLEIALLQYSPELQALASAQAGGADEESTYRSIGGRLADLLKVNPSVMDARFVLPQRKLVVGIGGVEPLAAALRKDPDTYLFLESYQAAKHAWIPQHRAFVGGSPMDVLVLAMPIMTENERGAGVFLVYLSFSFFREALFGHLSPTDYLFALGEEEAILLANTNMHFLRAVILPIVAKNSHSAGSSTVFESDRKTMRVMITVPSSRSNWKYVGVFTLSKLRDAGSGWLTFLVLTLLNLAVVSLLWWLTAGRHSSAGSEAALPGEKEELCPLSFGNYPAKEHHWLLASLRKGSSAEIESALERFLKQAQHLAHNQTEYCDTVTLLLFSYIQELPGGRSLEKAKSEAEILRTAIHSRQATELRKDLMRFFQIHSLSAKAGGEAGQDGKALSPTQLTALDRAIAFVHLRYTHCLSLDEIASVAGFSPRYFCSVFRLYTGRTVFQYLAELRVELAKRFLVETNDPVTLIAARVGYRNIQHFARVFRRLTSLSPLEYRRIERQFEYPSLVGLEG